MAKQNYKTLEERVDIRAGAITTRAFTLQPVPALLDIVGYPPDTEISIDWNHNNARFLSAKPVVRS
jgi:hypothetical protein